MHYQWLSQAYIVYTLYRIPYIVYYIAYLYRIPKKFQNFKIFQKKIKIFIKYMYYQRHGWNIWYNENLMSKSVSHAVSTLDLYHPSGRWPLGWYRVLGLIRHVIQILTCNIQYEVNDIGGIIVASRSMNCRIVSLREWNQRL